MPVTYKRETYDTVLRWTADTKIQYMPNPKTAGSKSHVRYAKYAKGKTVGEALAKGSYSLDLLFDYEHGYIKVLGGPIRKEPLNIKDRDGSWTKADIVLATMHNKNQLWTNIFELADRLGTDRRNLGADKLGNESMHVHAQRMEAQAVANLILERADKSGRKVTSEDITSVLDLWEFRQNTSRGNVMRDGIEWVNSDTLGLLNTYDGGVVVSGATKHYPSVSRLMSRWLKDHYPSSDIGGEFVFTSINVNRGYAARLHRDGNNVGPSMISAFGDFTGGELEYYADDDKALSLDDLMSNAHATVNIKETLLLFDGNRGHAVLDFSGQRYSLVFFCINKSGRASEKQRKELRDAGFNFPEEKEIKWAQSLLPPPRGYDKTYKAAPVIRSWKLNTKKEVSIFKNLSEQEIKQAKESSRKVPMPENVDVPADIVFTKHRFERVTRDDKLKELRVFLVGSCGRLVLAAKGVEDRIGTSRYCYEKLESFPGPELNTNQLHQVRQWMQKVIDASFKKSGSGALSEKGIKRKLSKVGVTGKSGIKMRKTSKTGRVLEAGPAAKSNKGIKGNKGNTGNKGNKLVKATPLIIKRKATTSRNGGA